ncbi:MAG: AAA family ATPase [Verrucomicrobia bacterium]|nr:AAA family ATPase [Verrucomicrobiota bacterium]
MNNNLPLSCSAPDDERWLLSAGLNGNPDAVAGLEFYNPVHADLGRLITRLAADGAVVELVTVSSAVRMMDNKETLEKLVFDVQGEASASASLAPLVKQCRDAVSKATNERKLWTTILDIQNRIRAGNSDSVRNELPAFLREQAEKLDQALGGDELLAVPLFDLQCSPHDDPNELLVCRYLCRGGSLLMVGPTGEGKSSLSMQMMLAFACGRECFGIKSARALKVLLVQAENDDGDLTEMRDGVLAGLDFTDAESDQARHNVHVISVNHLAGEAWLSHVDKKLGTIKPDILWIDPAFAYVPGDTNASEAIGNFCRRGINPLLTKHNCACIVVHHTTKPQAAKPGGRRTTNVDAYAGAGSAEWANWARAVLVLEARGKGRYRLHAAKRGGRLGWQDDAGTRIYVKHIEHCHSSLGFWWVESLDSGSDAGAETGPTIEDLLKHVPESRPAPKAKVMMAANAAGFGEKKLRNLLSIALAEETLFEWEKPRQKKKPEVWLARFEQPENHQWAAA